MRSGSISFYIFITVDRSKVNEEGKRDRQQQKLSTRQKNRQTVGRTDRKK